MDHFVLHPGTPIPTCPQRCRVQPPTSPTPPSTTATLSVAIEMPVDWTFALRPVRAESGAKSWTQIGDGLVGDPDDGPRLYVSIEEQSQTLTQSLISTNTRGTRKSSFAH